MSAVTQAPRVAVITGASSGIGLAAAKTLASQGWRVIGTGRDAGRMRAAQAAIGAVAAPGVAVDMIQVDLSLMRDAARAADAIAALTDRIDVLLNNAGGAAKERLVTAEGNEATFAGNHLGHFVLTQRLLPRLQASAAGDRSWVPRIVNVSSAGHHSAPGLDWNDLQMLDHFVPMPAYCNAKLANILFTRVLAERLAKDGIVAHAMHPGTVDSSFATHADATVQQYFSARKDLITPEDAADTLVWLATASEPGSSSGGYFHQREAVAVSAAANDMDAAHRLWRESEKLTGVPT